MGRIKIKLKECVFCGKKKPIFRNAPRKGPQCLDCYKYEKMKSKNFKNRALRLKKKEIFRKIKKELPKYVKEADKKFSQIIRLMYQREDKTILCYTCHLSMRYNEAQCGHYISREHYATRWLVDNARPQCGQCNSRHEEQPEIFKNMLEQEIPGITDQLQILARQVVKPTRSEIEDLIKDMTAKIKEIA